MNKILDKIKLLEKEVNEINKEREYIRNLTISGANTLSVTVSVDPVTTSLALFCAINCPFTIK